MLEDGIKLIRPGLVMGVNIDKTRLLNPKRHFMGPKVLSTYFQERSGVLRVAELLNSIRLIFRETPNADVGIDGQVEFVDEQGEATGATIAVQIKSGSSWIHTYASLLNNLLLILTIQMC